MRRIYGDDARWNLPGNHARLFAVVLGCLAMALAGCNIDGEDGRSDADPDTGVDAGTDVTSDAQFDSAADADMDADATDGGDPECDPNVGVGSSADRQYPELGWRWYYGQSAEDIQNRVDEGFRIVDLEVETVNPYTFSVAMIENSGRMQKGWWWYYGQSKSELDQKLNDKNARLIDLEVRQIGDARVFATVMIENVGDDQITNWRYIPDASPGTIVDDALDDDMRPIDADPWQSNSGATHSAILIDNTGDNSRAWWLYHGQDESEINSKLQDNDALLHDIDRAAGGDFTVIMDQPASPDRPIWWFYGFDRERMQELFRRLGSRIIDVQRLDESSDPEFLVLMKGWAHPRTGYPVDSLSAFDDNVQQLMWNWNSPGASLAVMKDGRLVYRRGYGYAHTGNDEAVQTDDRFRIASLSKALTKSAIFRLQDEGQLSLSDKVFTQHLPNLVPSGGPADSRVNNITIQHLLNHAGGWTITNSIPGTLNFDPMFADDKIRNDLGLSSPPSCSQRVTYVLNNYQLDFTPGTGSNYSNFGYCILGRVIDSVSGDSYDDYVAEQILQPAGVTGMQLGSSQLADQATRQVRYYDRLLDPKVDSVFPSVSGQVPQQYGGFYLEAMDAHGGWIGTPTDYVTYVDETEWAPYNPGWSFRGSLPGTQTAVQTVEDSDVVMTLFLNTRQGDWQQADLLGAMNGALSQVDAWPCHDLAEGSP